MGAIVAWETPRMAYGMTVMWVELTVAGKMPLAGPDHQETFNIFLQSGRSAGRALCSSQSPLNWMSKRTVTGR